MSKSREEELHWKKQFSTISHEKIEDLEHCKNILKKKQKRVRNDREIKTDSTKGNLVDVSLNEELCNFSEKQIDIITQQRTKIALNLNKAYNVSNKRKSKRNRLHNDFPLHKQNKTDSTTLTEKLFKYHNLVKKYPTMIHDKSQINICDVDDISSSQHDNKNNGQSSFYADQVQPRSNNLVPVEEFLPSNQNSSHELSANMTSEETTDKQCLNQNSSHELSSNLTSEEMTDKQYLNQLGSYCHREGTLVVALEPHSKLYIMGFFWLQLLFGDASIFGYQLPRKKKVPVYSLQTHAIFSIDSSNGGEFENITDEFTQNNSLSPKWLKDMFKRSKDGSIVIVQLSLYSSDLKNTISFSDAWKPYSSRLTAAANAAKDAKLWTWNVDAIPISPSILTSCALSLFTEQPEWKAFSSSFLEKDTPDGLSLIISGGKGTGKSTFLKYILNRLMSSPTVNEIACIDLDPGQPEFSLPGSLSLTKFSSPALGPPFTHQEGMTFSYFKSHLLGSLSVDNVLSEYLSIVETLVRDSLKFGKDVPLVVNTMGYTAGIGLDIIMDIIRTVRPTHVITLQGSKFRDNFSCELSSDNVNSSHNGIITRGPSYHLTFEYLCFDSYNKSKELSQPSSKQLRDMTILAYFSDLWKDKQRIHPSTCKPAVMVPWNKIALHTQGSYVCFSNILQAINASLVALCHLNEGSLLEVGNELPKKIKTSSSWLRESVCLGWAIVQGIDFKKQEIALLTPMSQKDLLASINTLIRPSVQLPMTLRKIFYAENSPYWEFMFSNNSCQRYSHKGIRF